MKIAYLSDFYQNVSFDSVKYASHIVLGLVLVINITVSTNLWLRAIRVLLNYIPLYTLPENLR